jgi:hypothetical protein
MLDVCLLERPQNSSIPSKSLALTYVRTGHSPTLEGASAAACLGSPWRGCLCNHSLTQHVIGIVIVSVAVFAAITSATLLSWLLMPCHRRMLYRYHDRAVVNVALVPCLACGRIDCMYLLVPAWPCLALLAYALTALTSCRARFYSLGKAQLRMLIHGTWAMNGLRP